jgi:hypothetical protein
MMFDEMSVAGQEKRWLHARVPRLRTYSFLPRFL